MSQDTFDRVIGTIHGLPDVRASRPSTITTVLPIVGNSQTFVVQTYKQGRDFTLFVQMVDAEGRARIVIPAKATAAIYRQREQLIKQTQREHGRAMAARRKGGS